MNKNIFKDINYGMYIISSKDEKNVGCVINTFTQLTSKNPIISICLNKDNYTNKVIKKTKKFAVSILSEKFDSNIIAKFGFQSSEKINKFENIEYQIIDDMPILNSNTCGYLICEIIDIIDVESHDLFIARVIECEKTNDLIPMTYKYYHEVIKGTAPQKASTYIEEKTEPKKEQEIYICDICGYVHYGPITDDFICPICGVNSSHFKKNI